MPEIFPHTRLRQSPYYEATLAEGAVSFTTYNRMLLPLSYGDREREYWQLIHGVQMWDVACQRQVQIEGPDAERLVQLLCPRDLSDCQVGQSKYVPLCNHRGVVVNDPVVLKLADDRYWLSIADSNVELWASCVAGERNLRVDVCEPDVSPLAIQGPRAEAVVASILGDWVRNLRHFWFREAEVDGIPLVVARSGWSKQGGFELYLTDGSLGDRLWNIVREAGRPWDIEPGYPNPVERVESGLLSWGGDTDDRTNPFEVGLGRFVDLGVPDDVVGIEALRRIAEEGPKRHLLGLVLDGDEPAAPHGRWYRTRSNGQDVGDMTNGIWSYRMKRNIGYALVAREVGPGERVRVVKPEGSGQGTLVRLPFVPPPTRTGEK